MARREKEDDDKNFDAFYRRLMKSDGLADIKKFYYIVTDSSRRDYKFYDEIQFLRFLLSDLAGVFDRLIQNAMALSKHPSDTISMFIYNDLKKTNKLDDMAGIADKMFPVYLKLLVLINESIVKPDKKAMVKAYNEDLDALYRLQVERSALFAAILNKREREASKKQKDVYIG